MNMRDMLVIVAMFMAQAALAEVRIEQWLNVPGVEITDVLATGELGRPADTSRRWETFEAVTSDVADVVSVTGIVRAPQDGDYRFMIAGDDTALLFVSTDARPKSLQQVAIVPAFGGKCEWTRYAAQRSDPIRLKAGQRCLVQAVVKSGGALGHVEVGWELPGGKIEGPIPAKRIETPAASVPLPSYGRVPAKVTLKPEVRPALSPGQHKFVNAATIESGERTFEMSYLLVLPPDYDKTSDSRPLFIFLHGNSHQGSDLDGVLNEGPAKYLNDRPELRQWMPMAMLIPQLPQNWRWDTPGAAEMTTGLIEEVCKQYPRFDRERVYLSGLSMGGKGVWLLAYESPGRYAAIIPISAVAVRPNDALRRLSKPYAWVICGERDNLFTLGSNEMYAALSAKSQGNVKLTVVPNAGHSCWDQFYPSRAFYEEVMTHRRGVQ